MVTFHFILRLDLSTLNSYLKPNFTSWSKKRAPLSAPSMLLVRNHLSASNGQSQNLSFLLLLFIYTTLLPPVLDHSADYTNYGNSLPQLCLPPSNLSATAWGKTDQKFLPGKVTMHSPAPRCDSLKVRPMALSERTRVHWQRKTGLRRGTCIAELKKKS